MLDVFLFVCKVAEDETLVGPRVGNGKLRRIVDYMKDVRDLVDSIEEHIERQV